MSGRKRIAILALLWALPHCGEDSTIQPGAAAAVDATLDSSLQGGDVAGQGDAVAAEDAQPDAAVDVQPEVDTQPACTEASCDDKNPCTDDKCDPAVGCKNTNNTAMCTDDNACTDKDACKDGKCAVGPVLDCDDKNICTTDSCDTKAGCVKLASAPTPCDDGDGCTSGDACKDSKCGAGGPLTCDDKNPCTDDTCDPKSGCAFANNSAACTDGNACTAGDACSKGGCVAGSQATVCDDKNACTDDTCASASGNCVYLPNATTCTDGDACTSGDACAGGACNGLPGACAACTAASQCDDKNPCTADTCGADGACTAIALAGVVTCSDGNSCTADDVCATGKCAGAATKCDDSNPCTDDGCVPGLGCSNANNAAACDDGVACSTKDTCTGGKCGGNLAACGCNADSECDDKNQCTDDACANGKCGNKPSGANKACEDGNGCTANDKCTNGVCLAGAATNCDDSNSCTSDACDLKTGKCSQTANSSPCNDGDACTVNDACKAGACSGGAALYCNDKNGCTTDSCDKVKGCQAVNNTDSCEDGNACTTADLCAAGACKGGAAPDCNDKNGCSTDSCDPKSGCVNAPNAEKCDDSNACTLNDVCTGLKCVGGSVKECDDKNPCTQDNCDPATGCVTTNTTLACDDANACTTADTCAAGACVGGAAPICDDANPCTTDSCDKVKGCQSPAVGDGTTCKDSFCDTLTFVDVGTCFKSICLPGTKAKCDDGNPCTLDTCDAAKGCAKTNSTDKCDDSNACTGGDVCAGGACVPGKPIKCDDANACTNDNCDIQKGCLHSAATDGTVCIGAACTGLVYAAQSICTTGSCGPTAGKKQCDDKDPCTNDACSATAGCIYTDNTAPCDDGNQCTTLDSCLQGVCNGGALKSCDDKNPCTDDKCGSTVGCATTNNTASCDDGSVCTTSDVCVTGQCNPGSKVVCDDKNPCTDESCDAAKGCVVVNNTATCNDGNDCNSGDICGNGVCKGSGGLVCDDNNTCTVDTCDAKTGCKYTALADGAKCTAAACGPDGYVAAAVCGAGKCGTVPAAQSCNDKNACTTDLCNAGQGCLNPINTAPCDDSNACTNNDACAGGACSGGKVACDDKNGCTDDTCDPKSGCVFTANTAVCDDANPCTDNDICGGKVCAGPVPTKCDDKSVCTDDTCNPKSGCVFTNNVTGCVDGDACTDKDTCSGGACAGTVVTCNDSKVCTNDSCDPKKGCVFTANTVPCDDGNACTDKDACAASACVPGAAKVCNDGNGCTDDACVPSTGCTIKNNTASCNDGSACTTVDACSGGACVGSVALNCDDKLECTVDSCVPFTGCANISKAFGTTCSTQAAGLVSPFCAGTLCTGFEVKVAIADSAATQGELKGIDRYAHNNGKVYVAGWQNSMSPAEGMVNNVVIGPLGLAAAGKYAQTSRLNDVRQRLAIGGRSNNSAAVHMILDTTTGLYNPGALDLGVSRPQLAIDSNVPPGGGERYWYGGMMNIGQELQSAVARIYWNNNQWGNSSRLLIRTNSSQSCSANLAVEVRDIYTAADNAVWFAGVQYATVGSGTAPIRSVVGYFDGNNHDKCDVGSSYSGEIYTENPSTANDFSALLAPTGTPALGEFTAIHGVGTNRLLVGGALGTLYSFNGTTWAALTPAYTGMPVAWSTAFNIKSIRIVGTEGWVAGLYAYTAASLACRAVFLLHGTWAANTGWTWDKQWVSTDTLATCTVQAPPETQLNSVWMDATGGALFMVGSQGTDLTGKIVQQYPQLQRPLVVRIPLK